MSTMPGPHVAITARSIPKMMTESRTTPNGTLSLKILHPLKNGLTYLHGKLWSIKGTPRGKRSFAPGMLNRRRTAAR